MAKQDNVPREVDALSERISQRLHEFRQRGEFTEADERLTHLTDRHQQLRSRLDTIRSGDWAQREPELAREHATLYDDLVKFEEELDAEAMRKHPHGRAPGAKSGLV
jgi:hypothetical protein